jgi:hypothetical protein
MPIQFLCSCGRKLQAQEEHVGRRVRCPACGAETTIPGASQAVQPRPAHRAAEDDDEAYEERPRRPPHDQDDERPRRRLREDEGESEYDEEGQATGTSGKAVAALVLGLLSFCLSAFAAVPAVILAIMSFGDIGRSRGRLRGKTLAGVGLALACAGMITSAVLLFLGIRSLMNQAVGKVQEAGEALQVSNNMKQMALGMINAADGDKQRRMLAPAICDKNGKPLLSWRVALLPHLGEDNLYQQFKLDEPWDGPNNTRLLSRMPRIYAHPADPDGSARGMTCYRVFTGPHTPFPDAVPPETLHSPCRFPTAFTDGTSNTILIIEAADAVPWTKPDELTYDPKKPLPKLGSRISRGACVAMADGSVFFIQPTVSEPTLRAAITLDDGMPLGPDWPGR